MATLGDHAPVPEIIEWRGVQAYRRCSVCGRMLDDDGAHVPDA